MAELEFEYKMNIEFSTPVIKHCFSLRCIPFDNEFQKITSVKTAVEPHNILTITTDGFGNKVLTDRIIEPHTTFSVTVSGNAAVDYSKRLNEPLNGIYKYPSEHTAVGERLSAFVSSLPSNFVTTPLETAQKLMSEIHKLYSYKSGVTNINTTAEEAFSLGCGVCQDFSHILIAALRRLGFSARYIAGLQRGTGETHAWVEVYDNGMWHGIDITNNKMIDNTYIILSHGRDFSDCGINRGLFIGGGTQTQTITATVREK